MLAGRGWPAYLKRGQLIMTTPKEAEIKLTEEELNLVTAGGDPAACVAACSEAHHCESDNKCVDKCMTECLK
jgi:hypothetical protein